MSGFFSELDWAVSNPSKCFENFKHMSRPNEISGSQLKLIAKVIDVAVAVGLFTAWVAGAIGMGLAATIALSITFPIVVGYSAFTYLSRKMPPGVNLRSCVDKVVAHNKGPTLTERLEKLSDNAFNSIAKVINGK